MKMNPKISVITVVYNDKEGLEKTIQSVLSQTYDNIEYIIVDGGSTDGSVDIIKKYQNRIGKWISEPDEGIYDAMNKGVGLSSGEWLNFMNAGDVFCDNKVLDCIFEKNMPEYIQFIYSDYWLEGADKKEKFLRIANRDIGTILHQSSIYRKQLHEKYGLYLITHPYTVSDLLFFLSVPSENFYKTSKVISINGFGGVTTQGNWCRERTECLKVVFNMKTIHQAYFGYLKMKIKVLIPYKFRRFVGKNILRHR